MSARGQGGEAKDVLLFMCVANSSRSQMAEALARTMAPPGLEVWSAGSEPTGVSPFAVEAMAEQGIDLGHAFTKTVDDVPRDRVRTVIMLCAEEVCPVFPGDVEKLHWPFEDPAAATGSDEDRLASFRRVRDQIHERLQRHFSER